MKRATPSRWLVRLLAIAVGLALTELALRGAGAAYLALNARDATTRPGPGGRLALCVGDSNVFGLWVDAEDAYPAVLEALLDEGVPGAPHRVVNLGVPGQSSHHVARAVRGQVRRYRPDVILVTCGANNVWAWGHDEETHGPGWLDDLRLVKTLRLLRERFGDRSEPGSTETAEFVNRAGQRVERPVLRDGSKDGGPSVEATLRRDLELVAREAEGAGVEVVLVGYAADVGNYRAANAALERLAPELGLPFVDPRPAGRELAERLGEDAVFFLDAHPRELGYVVVARAVHRHLAARGWGARQAFDDLLEGLGERAAPGLQVLGRLDGATNPPDSTSSLDAPRVRLEGEAAGKPFRVFFFLQPEDRSLSLEEILAHPLCRASLAVEGLGGVLDDRGSAEVPLAPLLAAGAPPELLRDPRLRVSYFVERFSSEEAARLGRTPMQYGVPRSLPW